MSTSLAATRHMKRIFTENFSVADIAESLASFDHTAPSAEVTWTMIEKRYRVAGVRNQGTIVGYVERNDLADGKCGDHLRPFEPDEVVPETLCFPKTVRLLTRKTRLFVITFGQVGGIVTRTDLQKPPARMWLFGMISIIEMGFVRLIESRFPEGEWKEYVSEARLERAVALAEERRRRNQPAEVLDCLQFSDKGQITLRDEKLRAQIGYESRRKGEETVKGLESLRNNLAHSQDILCCDWETIVRLTESLDLIFGERMLPEE
jgi:hypothetical protein